MGDRPSRRVPKDYDDRVFAKILDRVYDDIGRQGGRIDAVSSRVNILDRTQSSLSAEAPLGTHAEFYQIEDGGTEYGEGRISFTTLAAGLTIQGRSLNSTTTLGEANLTDSEAWTDLSGSFIADASYETGGYFRLRDEIYVLPKGDGVLHMQLQVISPAGGMLLNAQHTFDYDREPELRNLTLGLGPFDPAQGTNGKWPVYASVSGDEDVASIAFYADTNALEEDPSAIVDGSFTLPTSPGYVNGRNVAKQLIGWYDIPTAGNETTVHVAARGFSAVAKGGVSGVIGTVYDSIEIPALGSTTAGLLEDVAHRASIKLTGAHGSVPATEIDVTGTISYPDGTLGGTINETVTLSGTTLTYLYFDPATSQIALQQTTDRDVATLISGRRILVGIARGATAPERAFFVFTGDQPVITAPYVYAASLESLKITGEVMKTGALTVDSTITMDTGGSITIGTDQVVLDGTLGLSFDSTNSYAEARAIIFDDGTDKAKVWGDAQSAGNVSIVLEAAGTGIISLQSDTLRFGNTPHMQAVISGDDITLTLQGDSGAADGDVTLNMDAYGSGNNALIAMTSGSGASPPDITLDSQTVRVYDIGTYRGGTCTNGETFMKYLSARAMTITEIAVNAGTAPSSATNVTVAGQAISISDTSTTKATSLSVAVAADAVISASVANPANGMGDVTVTITATWDA